MDSFMSQRENEAECFSPTLTSHLLFFYLNVYPLFPLPLRCSLPLFLLFPHLTSCILLSVCFSPHASLLLFCLLLPSLCCHNTFCTLSFFLLFFFRRYEECESSCHGQDITLAYSRDRERIHTLTVKYTSNLI